MQPVFGQSSWLRPVALGQAPAAPASGFNCERTPEGGMRCSDGTYLPPGCQVGSPNTVQGVPQGDGSIWPYVAAAGALVAGAAAYTMSGSRMGDPAAFESSYPAAAADLQAIAGKITGERAADAWNFSQMQEAGKKKYDLLDQQKAAEQRLAQESKLWEQSHRNADALQAATAEVDRLNGEIAAANEKVAEYRGYVDANAANIMRFRSDAEAIIATLPEEWKLEGRLIIDPCVKGQKMSGTNFMGRVGMGVTAPFGSGGLGHAVANPTQQRRAKSSFKLPAYRPGMGQAAPGGPVAPVPATASPMDTVKDFLRVEGTYYLQGSLIGAVLGAGVNLGFPNSRLTRQEALTLLGVSSAGALIAGLFGRFIGYKNITDRLVGIGGAFAGNAIPSLLMPAPAPLPIYGPAPVMGWRKKGYGY